MFSIKYPWPLLKFLCKYVVNKAVVVLAIHTKLIVGYELQIRYIFSPDIEKSTISSFGLKNC